MGCCQLAGLPGRLPASSTKKATRKARPADSGGCLAKAQPMRVQQDDPAFASDISAYLHVPSRVIARAE
jgi:hypothetical protein